MGGVKKGRMLVCCLFVAGLMPIWSRSASKSLVLAQGEARSVKSSVETAETFTQQGNRPVNFGLFSWTSVFYAEVQRFLIG